MLTPRQQKYYRQGHIHGVEQLPGGQAGALNLRKMLADAMKLPVDEAVRQTLAHFQTRLNALPPIAKHPELVGMRECLVAYQQGVADGMQVSLDDVMIRANFLTMVTQALRVSTAKPADNQTGQPGCSLVYFPESEHGPLLANNQDGLASHVHTQSPGWIVANKAGLLLGTVSSGLFDDEQSPEQFPAPVFLMAYEMAGSTAEAVDLLTRLNLFWGPCNLLVGDTQGASAVIEKSTCRYGLRSSSTGFSATTEMSAEEPLYKAFLWEKRIGSLKARGLDETSVDFAYWKACEKRSSRLTSLVSAAMKTPSFAAIEKIIYDHTGQIEQVHMNGSACHKDQKPEDCEWTIRTTIWELKHKRAQVSYAKPPLSSAQTEKKWESFEGIEIVF